MPTVYLNIGSNQGDRHAQIEQAVALISAAWPQACVRTSEYVESEPWGYSSDAMFVNLGVALDFDVTPDAFVMFDELQRIERLVGGGMSHRNADGSYRDRVIDIDIIAIDRLRIDHSRLTVPHPRAHLREFVMTPMRELAPDAIVEWLSHDVANDL